MKIDIELVKLTLLGAKIDPGTTEKILQELMFEAETRKDDKEKEPKIRKQFVVVVNDPYGKLQELGWDFQGWIVQIPEEETPQSALQKIHNGVCDFNITPKGRRMPVETIAEACAFVSDKIYKEHKLWIKTKDPVLLIATSGKVPRN